MQAEHPRSYMAAETREYSLDETQGRKVVLIIYEALQDRDLPEECTYQTAVLLPKGKRGFQGIIMVRVLWNAASRILDT